MISRLSFVLILVITSACSSTSGDVSHDSGVDPDKKLTDMTATDIANECAFSLEIEGSRHTINCSDGSTITVGAQSQADCAVTYADFAAKNPSCEATVSEAESCFVALDDESTAELCSGTFPSECLAVFDASCTNQ